MSANYHDRAVVCSACPWRGNRVRGEQGFGTCPKCGGVVTRTSADTARKNAQAKAQLAVYTS